MDIRAFRRGIRPGILALLLAVLGAAAIISALVSAPREAVWLETAPGLAVRTVQVGEASVTAVRAGKGAVLRVVDVRQGRHGVTRLAPDVCPANGAAINAGFFDDDVKPLGLLVIDGKKRQDFLRQPSYSTFLLRRGKAEIVPSAEASLCGVTQAIECKPRLVIAGQIPHFKPQLATPRSAVGIDTQGRIILAATRDALTLEQWAACLRDTLGCPTALNLDGGPSTQLAVRGKVTVDIPGGWGVPVFITVQSEKRGK